MDLGFHGQRCVGFWCPGLIAVVYGWNLYSMFCRYLCMAFSGVVFPTVRWTINSAVLFLLNVVSSTLRTASSLPYRNVEDATCKRIKKKSLLRMPHTDDGETSSRDFNPRPRPWNNIQCIKAWTRNSYFQNHKVTEDSGYNDFHVWSPKHVTELALICQ